MSRWQIVGLAINDVVGSGIYLLPAAVAALLGAASVWAMVLAGLAVALLVLCFAEASSHFDQPGGAYLYTRAAFGRFVGFEVGWMTWLSRVAAIASLANGLVLASTQVAAAAAGGWTRVAILCGVILVLAWINIRGVKGGARTAVVLAVAKMLPLVFFVVVGAWFVEGSRLAVPAVPRGGATGRAALPILRRRPDYRRSVLRLPFGSTIPVAALALALALLVTAKVSNLLPVIAALGVGAIIFHFRRPDTVERVS